MGTGEWIGVATLAFTLLAALIGVAIHLAAGYYEAALDPESLDFPALKSDLRRGGGFEKVYRRQLLRWLRRLDVWMEGPRYRPENGGGTSPSRGDGVWRWIFKYVFRRPPDYVRYDPPRTWMWRPDVLSTAAFDRCLLLAIVYPLAGALLTWLVVGEAGQLGEAIRLEANPDVWLRLYALISTGLALALLLRAIRSDGTAYWVGVALAGGVSVGSARLAPLLFANTDGLAGAVAFAFVAAFAVAVAGAVAVAVGVAGAVAVAVAVAVAGAVAFAVAFAVAVAFAGAVAFAFAHSTRRLGPFLAIVSTICLVAAFLVVGRTGSEAADPKAFGLLVALVLVPLVNAFYDWLSIGLTRWLLRFNLARASQWRRTLSWIADFAGALGLLVALAITMILALEGFNAAGYAAGLQEPIAPVEAVIRDIGGAGFAAKHAWVYFALFSTLLPTVLHGVLGIFSALTVYQPKLRDRMLKEIEDGRTADIAVRKRLAWKIVWQWIVSVLTALMVAAAFFAMLVAVFHADRHFLDLMAWTQQAAERFFYLLT